MPKARYRHAKGDHGLNEALRQIRWRLPATAVAALIMLINGLCAALGASR